MIERFLRTAGASVLALATVACSSGLTGNEWLWCKENLVAVDAAAQSVGIAKAQVRYQEPTWWADYVASTVTLNNAAITQNPDFLASCDLAADQNAVAEGRRAWCLADGIDQVWTASIQSGHMVDLQAETFAYRAVPLADRSNDTDFVRACRKAFSPT